jgi:CDP-glucose 4,6-dehydratase
MMSDFWRGRRVLITGHTGFKGGWLAAWLTELGARVYGLALAPETPNSFFELCGLEQVIHSTIGDVRDAAIVSRALEASNTEVVFHLAAQALVRRSYREPAVTFETNVIGTVNVLEAIRRSSTVRSAVIVTSDKCYESHGSPKTYREDDRLGGSDPYSASKACTELVANAYAKSFFDTADRGVAIATARAGNVIGGGDQSLDRIVPDAIRALSRNETLIVRNPDSVRPWQHVLEPLSGYLMLAERLYNDGKQWSGPWNFGPDEGEAVRVADLVDMLVKEWGEGAWRAEPASDGMHEAPFLGLDSDRARTLLSWKPRLNLREAVRLTIEWYREAASGPSKMYELTAQQMPRYEGLLHAPDRAAPVRN